MKIQNKIIIFIVFLALTGFTYYSPMLADANQKGKDQHGMPPQNSIPPGDRPLLVEFFSNDCGICVQLKPGIKQLEEQFAGSIDFMVIDSDKMENARLVSEFNVSGLPAFFLMTAGREIVTSGTGMIAIADLREALLNLQKMHNGAKTMPPAS